MKGHQSQRAKGMNSRDVLISFLWKHLDNVRYYDLALEQAVRDKNSEDIKAVLQKMYSSKNNETKDKKKTVDTKASVYRNITRFWSFCNEDLTFF